MIDIAFGLQQSTKDAMFDPYVLDGAREVLLARQFSDEVEFTQALFEYSARLASVTTTLATEVLMNGDQLSQLLDTLRELESVDELGQDF